MSRHSYIIKEEAPRRRRPKARLLSWPLIAIAVAVCIASPAHAQVDTAAARQGRAALRGVRQAYGSVEAGEKLLDTLALADVEHELCAGGRAQREPLEAAASKLRRGASSQFADERFQKFATALERRAAEIAWIPAEEWPAACRREADSYRPVTEERLLAARKFVDQRLNDFERRLPAAAKSDQGWRALLAWPRSRALVATPLDESLPLDDLERRWRGAPSAWNAPELIEASLAMQLYIPLLRRYLMPESAEQHAATWNEISRLLDSRSIGTSILQRLAELIVARERRGEAPMLTSSIRHELSRPNVVITARAGWLERLFSSRIEDRFPVNDVFGGSRSVGTGVMQAETRAQFLPSSAVGQVAMKFNGTSRARTVATSEGVTVRSNSTTRIDGTKRVFISADGLSTRPAVVNANTSITYENINASGLRRRREESIRQAYARRPRAEADASALTRRSTAERLDEEGVKLVNDFNRTYRDRLQKRQFSPSGQTVDVRVVTAGDTVRWQCCLENPLLFAAQSTPPVVDPPADLQLSLAASAFEDQTLPIFGGRQLSSGEMAEAISEVLGEPRQAAPSARDFTATFAARPCEVNFAGGEAAVRLFFTAFDSAEVQYPALTVDTQYAVGVLEGALVLTRIGTVRVLSAASSDGQRPAVAGRQQTLRVAVQRKFNKVLPEKITWQPPPVPRANAKSVELHVERAVADGGWLWMGLDGG